MWFIPIFQFLLGKIECAAHVTIPAAVLTVPIFNERDKNTNCEIIA